MNNTDCVIWTKALDSHGYGQSWRHGKPYKAHRAAWEEHYNVVLSSDQFLLHKCDTPACINPDHLYIGNQKDNMQDRKNRNRWIPPKGEEVSWSKLTEAEIKLIKELPGLHKDIAKQFGISRSCVSLIKGNKRWKHID